MGADIVRVLERRAERIESYEVTEWRDGVSEGRK
jgi:hypothetical protein